MAQRMQQDIDAVQILTDPQYQNGLVMTTAEYLAGVSSQQASGMGQVYNVSFLNQQFPIHSFQMTVTG